MVYIDGEAETQSLPEPESSEGREGREKVQPHTLWEHNIIARHGHDETSSSL